ncbi:gas vesicle protein [Pseudomonas sp. N40(2020)]|uniref:gas vesicle accessory protein GvpU n=1 Tax=Pseudomonas sp. N40(2020) TaxID=2767798 RepID=UPI001656D1F0|nr:gas vesicle accessory protein GvpU [Pseudomonas sp. N40(2020)]MBC8994964.1 gas vesicle protein [Pseudomonas sp. N40(2020)]
MSDETVKNPSHEEYFGSAPTVKSEWDGRQVDWLLQWLSGFINDTNIRIGVTLTVGGNMVTGTLIPHEAYFERLATDISTPFADTDPEGQEALYKRIIGFGKADPEVENLPNQYVHLDNARVHTGGNQILPSQGTLWRGKVSAIDGFILGELNNV